MKRLRLQNLLHNLIVTVGIGIAALGILNAATVVSAISTPSQSTLEEGEAYAFPLLSPQSGKDPGSEAAGAQASLGKNLAPSASFLARAHTGDTVSEIRETNNQLLEELYAAEMLYPDFRKDETAELPKQLAPEIPLRIVIPAIELDAPILPSEAAVVEIAGKPFQVWHAPDEFAVGWHVSSATLGVPGNTVLNGHHNIQGEVFKRLVELEQGDEIILHSEYRTFSYTILNKMILPEKYAPLEDRVRNSQWILPSEDERLTIVTCWPYESNTHRLILVAKPNQ